jgi:hypothetical protein
MTERISGELTSFEKMLVDSVADLSREDAGGRHGGPLRWHRTQKGEDRSIFVFYQHRSSSPAFFAKASSHPGVSFEREFNVLRQLGQDTEVVKSLPEVVAYIQDAGCSAIVERAVDGIIFPPVGLRRFWQRPSVRAHVASVLSWWRTLVRTFPGSDGERLLIRQIDEIRAAFLKRHNNNDLFSGCEEVLERVATFASARPMLSVVHGDLWRENILCQRTGGIVVLDWERSEKVGLPLLDVLLFLSTLIDDSSQSGMANSLWMDNWLSKTVRSHLVEACSFLNLSRAEAEDLFFFFMITMSSQAMRLFGLRTEWDENWYHRLNCALQNRESVHALFSTLPEETGRASCG